MAPDQKLALTKKLLKLRALELRGATEGERSAAGQAFDRVSSKAVPCPRHARKEIDAIQARLDDGATFDPPAPAPRPHPFADFQGGVIFVQGGVWEPYGYGTGTGTNNATTGFSF